MTTSKPTRRAAAPSRSRSRSRSRSAGGDGARGSTPREHARALLVGALALTLPACVMPNPAFGEVSATDVSTSEASASDSLDGTTDSTSAGVTGDAGTGTQGATTGVGTTEPEMTTGGVCVDLDEDGFTDCDGDCDDEDPDIRPGRPEICGDNLDNNCDGEVDDEALCMGYGTFVSQLTGNDVDGFGTQESPFKTIAKAVDVATTIIGTPIEIYVAEGSYSEAIGLVEGVSLVGGFQCADDCTWEHDPSKYKSKLMAINNHGLIAGADITAATEVSGFEIYGLGGPPEEDGGRAAVTIDRGTPSIRANTIFGPPLDSCMACYTAGIRISGASNDPAGAQIINNYVQAGNTAENGFFAGSHAIATFADANAGVPIAYMSRNTLVGGSGNWARTLRINAAASGTKIKANHIYAGSPAQGGSSYAAYLHGEIEVDGNFFNTNPGMTGVCVNPSEFGCGGLEVDGVNGAITNNVIHGMQSPISVGVRIGNGELPGFGEDLLVSNNTIDAGGSGDGSFSAGLLCSTAIGNDSLFGRIRNNIILGGQGNNSYGVIEQSQPNKTCKPNDFDHNLLFGYGTLYQSWDGQASIVIGDVNTLNGEVFASNNLVGDPALDDSHHLTEGSPAIDAGTDFEAPEHDMDGEGRPKGQGYDIGADER